MRAWNYSRISLATIWMNILIDACFVLTSDQALLFVNNNGIDDDEDGDDVMRMTMILHGRI